MIQLYSRQSCSLRSPGLSLELLHPYPTPCTNADSADNTRAHAFIRPIAATQHLLKAGIYNKTRNKRSQRGSTNLRSAAGCSRSIDFYRCRLPL